MYGKICFLNDNANGEELDQIIRDAIVVASSNAGEEKHAWLNVKNYMWLKAFNKNTNQGQSTEQIMMDKKDAMQVLENASLVISDISNDGSDKVNSNRNIDIIIETSNAINDGKPPVIVLYEKAPFEFFSLEQRAHHTIQYSMQRTRDLQKRLEKKFETFRSKAEKSEGDKNWDRLIDKIKVPIYTLDKNRKIDFFNDAAFNFFNIPEDEIVGKDPIGFLDRIRSEKIIHTKSQDTFDKHYNETEDAIINKRGKLHIEGEPLLYIVEGKMKLSHLQIYNGGTKGSLCVFWSIEKKDKERAALLLKGINDLLGFETSPEALALLPDTPENKNSNE